ncbi:MAG TPA: PAS domain-containing sensor histidine kinase [Rhizomicrobium sp.]|nr:PAS domain-containing sensor histidine kinase [Rhizomicrobium sp.]
MAAGAPPARTMRPELPVAILSLLVGAVLGAAAGRVPAAEALAGMIVLSTGAAVIFWLNRLADRDSGRLLEAETTYRAFFEQAIEGVFRTSSDGRYLDANPALAKIYGYGSPEALVAGLTDIADQLYVDPRRRAEFQAIMQANDRVSSFESEIRRRDGKLIWISENARAVRDWTGKIVCYEGTVEDVTERHRAQQKLRGALAEAEEASRAKSAFLAAMSHELKTPLNAVLGFSEIIKDEVLGPISPERYRGYAEDIHASGKRLLTIVCDVLDVAQLSGGAITLQPSTYTPKALIDEAITLARRATKDERDVSVTIPDIFPTVDVDSKRLRQAIANLIGNALKFTPPGGAVSVTVRLERSGGMSFVVTDTGIGMEPQTISAALEPFRQLDRSLSRRFEGAGLGLSITKSIVELHGGVLLIESAVGEGTTASIVLPASRTKPRAALAG